ncbi:MAG: thioredoxin domain-containing protein [Candidatus Bathyarchaeia archaeon]
MTSETKAERKPNRLIHEKSPYLLQHAYNPVDWYPWSQEAFDKAKAEDKPIFLSIGYSSCHWCHVMEKECFDDEEVARLLNEAFVCIKVDREERPDLDAAYMAVCQAMGRSCGWPLNVMLTPRMNPFFAASYIPKHSQHSMTGIVDLVPQVMDIWRLRRKELEIVGADIRSRLEAFQKRTPEKELGKEALDEAYEKLTLEFDAENGGFGGAPKFPIPHHLLFLLRYWKRTGKKDALAMVEKTLRAMRLGGIFDQVGLGFHRYSTDAQWLVPHFEKMFYDQALLTLAYAEAYQATHAPKFMITVKETLWYVLKELAAPEGAFYSAEDADSEGVEGKFYVWTEKEIRDALPAEDATLATRVFTVKPEGNFSEPGKTRSGENILHIAQPLEQTAQELGLTLDELILRIGGIQRALMAARDKRVRPSKDDKILTDWNGLMIAALAKASQVLNDERYLQAAVKTADFVLSQMRGEDGTLFHRYVKGERAVEGFLDDYAFLAFGLLEVYEASFQERYLQAASQLMENMVARFWDEKDGGFFFTAKRDESTLPRMKQVYDGAIPSGNSVAALNLLRLAVLTDKKAYRDLVDRIRGVFAEEVKAAPWAHTFMLTALDFAVGPAYSVILVGDLGEKDTDYMLVALRRHYLPNTVVSLKQPGLAGLGYEKIDGKATAYVCRDQTCLPPTNSVEKMLESLEAA